MRPACFEEARRKAERERLEAEAEERKAQADARATTIRADADKQRILDESIHLTPNYLRLQAVNALASALKEAKLVVVPVGSNGLPSFFALFLNPLGSALEAAK